MNQFNKSILVLTLAVMATLVAGVVIGLVAGFLSNMLYVPLLFPLGMGQAAGWALWKIVRAARVRVRWQAVALGGLAALAVYGGYQALNYVVGHGEMVMAMYEHIQVETGERDVMLANTLVEYGLRQETGFSGFPGYLLYSARQGLRLGQEFGAGVNLGPFFTWVYWLLELGIIAWIAVGKGRQAAARGDEAPVTAVTPSIPRNHER